ncbi:protein starmaker-like isoform X1 [Aethina tumida]|uniref:protein starmaker-like isoform X1 n=1 Tax=Aethina tumida TaxID=116153 RepID=UPI002148D8A5|nr:protein starmaker-like isoform X1 [Aethina tumida]
MDPDISVSDSSSNKEDMLTVSDGGSDNDEMDICDEDINSKSDTEMDPALPENWDSQNKDVESELASITPTTLQKPRRIKQKIVLLHGQRFTLFDESDTDEPESQKEDVKYQANNEVHTDKDEIGNKGDLAKTTDSDHDQVYVISDESDTEMEESLSQKGDVKYQVNNEVHTDKDEIDNQGDLSKTTDSDHDQVYVISDESDIEMEPPKESVSQIEGVTYQTNNEIHFGQYETGKDKKNSMSKTFFNHDQVYIISDESDTEMEESLSQKENVKYQANNEVHTDKDEIDNKGDLPKATDSDHDQVYVISDESDMEMGPPKESVNQIEGVTYQTNNEIVFGQYEIAKIKSKPMLESFGFKQGQIYIVSDESDTEMDPSKQSASHLEDVKSKTDNVHTDKHESDNECKRDKRKQRLDFTVPLDPILKIPIKHPLRSSVCNHVFERHSIKNHIKIMKLKNKPAWCPYIGCQTQFSSKRDLVKDRKLKKKIAKYTAQLEKH